jgi:hypothetical protein
MSEAPPLITKCAGTIRVLVSVGETEGVPHMELSEKYDTGEAGLGAGSVRKDESYGTI